MLKLLFFIFPLGLDTLGVSLSLGIKSARGEGSERERRLPTWLRSALLFALAETLMPLVGLAMGYAASLAISQLMHFVGPLILIAVGLYKIIEEGCEYLARRKSQQELAKSGKASAVKSVPGAKSADWRTQLLLALSISLDELAVGFSLGAVGSKFALSPLLFCLLIGLQGFLMTFIGLTLGRLLKSSGRGLKQGSEWVSALLLIGLGVWLLLPGN